jgi:hypothetical protein
MEQQKHASIHRRADGPIHKYRSQVQRFSTTGLAPEKISAITGVPILVLEFHFSHEITRGEGVTTLFHKPSAARQPAKQKRSYPSQPFPPGTIVVCGPNGKEITHDANGNQVRSIKKGFEHLPENIEFLRNCPKPTNGVVESATGVGNDRPEN